jgi:hypothetical protein
MTQARERRLRVLEGSYGIGGGFRCPDCGGRASLDGKPDPDATYELIFVDPEEDHANEWCQVCGRQTHVVVSWDV